MDLNEVKNLLNEKLDGIKSQLSGVGTKEEFNEIKNSFAELQNEVKGLKDSGLDKDVLLKMQNQLDKIDVKLKGQAIALGEAKTLDQEVKNAFASKEIIDGIQEMKGNRNASVNMELKAVGTMMLSTSYAGNSLTTEVDRNVSKAPKRMPLFRDIMNVSTISGNRVVWVNKEATEGSAGMTSEGAKKSQVSWTYTEESANVQKLTAFIKVSKEMLDDLDFMRSEINSDLREEIELTLDTQLGNGNGTAPNLKGILQYAKDATLEVVGTGFENSIAKANRLDALRILVAMISLKRFRASYIAISPVDAAIMDLAKGEDGHYIMPPFVTANGQTVAGIPVIASESIGAGEFLIGDFSKANLRIKEDIVINLGYENDDFTKNLVTILAEMRAVHYVKKHHIPAFLKGKFSEFLPKITAPVTPVV